MTVTSVGQLEERVDMTVAQSRSLRALLAIPCVRKAGVTYEGRGTHNRLMLQIDGRSLTLDVSGRLREAPHPLLSLRPPR